MTFLPIQMPAGIALLLPQDPQEVCYKACSRELIVSWVSFVIFCFKNALASNGDLQALQQLIRKIEKLQQLAVILKSTLTNKGLRWVHSFT